MVRARITLVPAEEFRISHRIAVALQVHLCLFLFRRHGGARQVGMAVAQHEVAAIFLTQKYREHGLSAHELNHQRLHIGQPRWIVAVEVPRQSRAQILLL